MDKKKRIFIAFTFFFGMVSVALIITAFATNHWLESSPIKRMNTTDAQPTAKTGGSETKFTGNISLGLFRGYRVVDYGTGARRVTIHIKKDLIDFGLFNFGLWVSTIVMLALGIVWGLVSMGFAVFNVFGKPIETVTGPMGLYLWNGLALCFTLLACLLFVGLFLSGVQDNIMPKEDIDVGWTSKDRTHFDYSFYLVVAAVFGFFVNIVLLLVSGQKLSCSYSRAGEKEIDNGMILY